MKTNVCNIQNTRVMLLTINTLQMLKIIYTNVNLRKKNHTTEIMTTRTI